jgi:hypothetical protein
MGDDSGDDDSALVDVVVPLIGAFISLSCILSSTRNAGFHPFLSLTLTSVWFDTLNALMSSTRTIDDLPAPALKLPVNTKVIRYE